MTPTASRVSLGIACCATLLGFGLLAAGCLDYGQLSSGATDASSRGATDGATDGAIGGPTDSGTRPPAQDGGPSDMAFSPVVRYVNYATSGSVTGPSTSVSVTLMGAASGDYALIAVHSDSGTVTFPPPDPTTCSRSYSSPESTYSMFWCVHFCEAADETVSLTLDQSSTLTAVATIYGDVKSVTLIDQATLVEGGMHAVSAPSGGAVVAMVGYDMPGPDLPNWTTPGFELREQLAGIALFDSGIMAPVPSEFALSIAGFDLGTIPTMFPSIFFTLVPA